MFGSKPKPYSLLAHLLCGPVSHARASAAADRWSPPVSLSLSLSRAQLLPVPPVSRSDAVSHADSPEPLSLPCGPRRHVIVVFVADSASVSELDCATVPLANPYLPCLFKDRDRVTRFASKPATFSL